MNTLLAKQSITISNLVLFGMLIGACLYPTRILLLEIVLLGSFTMLSFAAYKKHQEAYLRDRVLRTIFVRNTSIEIASILLILILAGLSGWYVVELATSYVDQSTAKFVVGIAVGLITGVATSTLVKRVAIYLKRILSIS